MASAHQCYILYLAPGQNSDKQYDADGDRIADAYHGAFQMGNQWVYYEVISGDAQDDIPQLAAHELAETVTDPIPGRGWVTTQPLSLVNGQWVVDTNNGQRQEIGDIFESFSNAAFNLNDANGVQHLFVAMSDKNGNMIFPPPPSSPPPTNSPSPSSPQPPKDTSILDLAIDEFYKDVSLILASITGNKGFLSEADIWYQKEQNNVYWGTQLGNEAISFADNYILSLIGK